MSKWSHNLSLVDPEKYIYLMKVTYLVDIVLALCKIQCGIQFSIICEIPHACYHRKRMLRSIFSSTLIMALMYISRSHSPTQSICTDVAICNFSKVNLTGILSVHLCLYLITCSTDNCVRCSVARALTAGRRAGKWG